MLSPRSRSQTKMRPKILLKEAGQDPESAGDAGEPEEEVLEAAEPALTAAEDQPAEEDSSSIGDPEEEVTPISAEETPVTDALEDIESYSTEIETPPEEVVTEPEMDILKELSAEADDDKIEPLELTDDDLASLLDDGAGGAEPEVAAATTAEACRRICRHSAVPIIMLTARGSPQDQVEWLDAGADDYLPKPFSTRELMA